MCDKFLIILLMLHFNIFSTLSNKELFDQEVTAREVILNEEESVRKLAKKDEYKNKVHQTFINLQSFTIENEIWYKGIPCILIEGFLYEIPMGLYQIPGLGTALRSLPSSLEMQQRLDLKWVKDERNPYDFCLAEELTLIYEYGEVDPFKHDETVCHIFNEFDTASAIVQRDRIKEFKLLLFNYLFYAPLVQVVFHNIELDLSYIYSLKNGELKVPEVYEKYFVRNPKIETRLSEFIEYKLSDKARIGGIIKKTARFEKIEKIEVVRKFTLAMRIEIVVERGNHTNVTTFLLPTIIPPPTN